MTDGQPPGKNVGRPRPAATTMVERRGHGGRDRLNWTNAKAKRGPGRDAARDTYPDGVGVASTSEPMGARVAGNPGLYDETPSG